MTKGWHGYVTSGYRTPSEQMAAAQEYAARVGQPISALYAGGNPLNSNHLKTTFPGGAVDVDGGSDEQLIGHAARLPGPRRTSSAATLGSGRPVATCRNRLRHRRGPVHEGQDRQAHHHQARRRQGRTQGARHRHDHQGHAEPLDHRRADQRDRGHHHPAFGQLLGRHHHVRPRGGRAAIPQRGRVAQRRRLRPEDPGRSDAALARPATARRLQPGTPDRVGRPDQVARPAVLHREVAGREQEDDREQQAQGGVDPHGAARATEADREPRTDARGSDRPGQAELRAEDPGRAGRHQLLLGHHTQPR